MLSCVTHMDISCTVHGGSELCTCKLWHNMQGLFVIFYADGGGGYETVSSPTGLQTSILQIHVKIHSVPKRSVC